MVQCARISFGLSGIYDSEEAFRVAKRKNSMGIKNDGTPQVKRGMENLLEKIRDNSHN